MPERLSEPELSATIESGIEASEYLPQAYVRRTGAPKVAAVGDSIVAFETNYSTAFSQLGPLMAGDRLQWFTSSGVGGYTLAQIESILLPPVLADVKGPYTAVLIGGGTNNMGTGSITTAAASLTSILATLTADNITPILWTPPPRALAAGGTYNADTAAFASYVREIGNANGWQVLDAHRLLADATTGVLAAAYDSGDGIHPNYAGHLVLARAFAAIIRTIYPVALPTGLYSPLGPEKTATTGLFAVDTNADGKADGVGSYGSPVCTVVAGAPVGKWQRSAFSTGVAPSGAIRVDVTGITPGNVYEVSYLFEAVSGVDALRGTTYSWRSSSAQIATFGGNGRCSIGVRALEASDRLYVRYRETAPVGSDRIRMDLYCGAPAPAANGYVQMAQWAIRDLTALGIA
jgi:lysophospholipase L1-like esterase